MPETVKKVVKKAKAAEKPVVKKVAAKKETVALKAPVTKKTGLHVDVLDTNGKVVETMTLPSEIFGAKVNHKLMAQAVRVYLANQRLGTASIKTRGEVDGSTRKIYRQKGTGRARHGGVRAPIFVKGGVAHGPKPKDYTLSLSKPMKKVALFSALSAKAKDGEIQVISGILKAETKTKVMAKALSHVGYSGKGSMLLVLPEHLDKVHKSVRNLEAVTVTPASLLNTYEVLKTKKLVFLKEAIEAMVKMTGEKKHA